MVTPADLERLFNEVSAETEEKERKEKMAAEEEARRLDRDRYRDRDSDHNRDQDRNRNQDHDRDHDRDRDRNRERDYYRGRDHNHYGRGGRERFRDPYQYQDRRCELNEDEDKDRARGSSHGLDKAKKGRRDRSRARSNRDADTDEDYDRYRRSTSRDRHRRRDRGGGDYYSGGGRIRSRSRSPYRERDRDDQRGGRYRERSRERRRPATPSPEVTEDDRDKRTVFVQQISARAEQRHLRQFFEVAGPVIDAQIVKDRVTQRSKGVGYVEFKSEETVPKALELTGQKLKGVPIIVQLTEAEKNRASRNAAAGEGAANANGAPFHRLYIGNIHFSVTEEDLREIFCEFGELEQVTLQRDDKIKTRSKGYGFVQYVDPENAKVALKSLNQLELAGRQIRLGLGSDKFTPESTAHLLRNFPNQTATYQGSAFSGAGGRGAAAGGSGGVFDRTNGRDERTLNGASALDDSDMSGVNFKQVDRNKLMANLARNEVEVPVPKSMQPVTPARSKVVDMPMASKCIKIENAFDPEQEFKEFGVNWTKILEKEIKDECDAKYGKVLHLSADPNSEGDVYVKFDSVKGGEKALQGLNGRNYNHRVIRASYVVDKIYDSLFGAAASKN